MSKIEYKSKYALFARRHTFVRDESAKAFSQRKCPEINSPVRHAMNKMIGRKLDFRLRVSRSD